MKCKKRLRTAPKSEFEREIFKLDMPRIHKMFAYELKKDCFSRCNPNMFCQLETSDHIDDRLSIF